MEEWKANCAEYQKLLEGYNFNKAAFDSFVRKLPEAERVIVREIAILNNQILTSSQNKEENIKRLNELKRNWFRQAVIDRIVGKN
jgi:hypothetical protein